MLDLISRLRTIPHLPLPAEFDLPAMADELQCIDEYVPYTSKCQEGYERMHAAFLGRSLTSPDGDSRSGLTELYSETGQPTELCSRMPVIMTAVRRLCADQQRARIMMIPGHKSLYWHRHVRQLEHLCTVQLPLVMPEDFTYEVTSVSNIVGDLNNQQIVDDALVYRARYAVGKATIFNSYHMHNVFNRSTTARITLLLYADLSMPGFQQLVRDAVAAYDGPTM